MSQSDVVAAPTSAVPEREPAPVAKPRARKTATKPKKPSAHPMYKEMISVAIKNLKERGGSSRQAILKYIMANFQVGDKPAVNSHLKLALKNGVQHGYLKQSKGIGASGSFKLGETEKPVTKKSTKKSGAKKTEARRTAKKTAVKKRSEKAKSPKKAAKKSASKKQTKKAKSPKKSPVKKVKSPKKAAGKKPVSKKQTTISKPAIKAAKKPAPKKTATKK